MNPLIAIPVATIYAGAYSPDWLYVYDYKHALPEHTLNTATAPQFRSLSITIVGTILSEVHATSITYKCIIFYSSTHH